MTEPTPVPVSILDRIAAGEDLTAKGSDLEVGVDQRAKTRPLLSSVDEMRRVFEDVVMQRAPSAERRREMATTGTHIDPETKQVRVGHRFRIETGYLPVEGFVGQLTLSQFATFTVPMMIDTSNWSAFIHTLQRNEQPSGQWVPVAVQTRIKTFPTRNGRVPADFEKLKRDPVFPASDVDPTETIAEWIGTPGPQVVEVAADAMFYSIVWMDVKNAPDDPPLDAQGRPTPQANVTVNTGTDPNLVKVLEKLADRSAPVQAAPVDTGMAALLDKSAEVDALRAEVEQLRKERAVLGVDTKKAPK